MSDIDFEKLLKLAAAPEVGKNADSFSGMLKNAEGVLSLIENAISIADRAGTLPGLVRIAGKKFGVDVDSPLKTRIDDTKIIIPASDYHLQVLSGLNRINEKDLKAQFEAAAKVMKEHNGKTNPDPGTLTDPEHNSAQN